MSTVADSLCVQHAVDHIEQVNQFNLSVAGTGVRIADQLQSGTVANAHLRPVTEEQRFLACADSVSLIGEVHRETENALAIDTSRCL